MATNEEYEGEEFEFPDETEVKPDKETTSEDNDIELEIVDDTPAEDKNRKPLPKDVVEAIEKDDLTDYSDRVKERMAQLRKVYHDERREKEAAAREREEAVRYAQAVYEENKKLKTNLSAGEKTYIEVARNSAEHEMNLARKAYREAYDLGDTDKIIEAQESMNMAQYKLTQMKNYRPQYEKALQDDETSVQLQPERLPVVRPDTRATKWQEQNEWFGQDEEMTSLALGLHEKLVRGGTDPTSDTYYRSIDNTMRKRFPEYFEDDSMDEDQPAQRKKPSTVVAPASRSTAPKKVRLSSTAAALAKKLGVTPEQYARETLKLETR
jgi:hypothetical protein